MKNIIFILVLLIFISPIFGAEYASKEGDLKVTANILQLGKKTVKAKNKINVTAKLDTSTTINVKCNQLQINASDEGSTSIKNLKNCIFRDSVIVKYDTVNEKGIKSSYLSKSDGAFYDGKTQNLVLTGNVKIDYISSDGSKMSAVGKKAVLNLNKDLKENDIIFAIEGDDDAGAKLDSNIDHIPEG